MSDESNEFEKDVAQMQERVIEKCAELREFCDSVVIICTMTEGIDSQLIFNYRGNYYAVMGSIDRFLEMRRTSHRLRDEEGLREEGA